MLVEGIVKAHNEKEQNVLSKFDISSEERQEYEQGMTRIAAVFDAMVLGRREVYPHAPGNPNYRIYEAVDMGVHQVNGRDMRVAVQPYKYFLTHDKQTVAWYYQLHVAALRDVDLRTMHDHLHSQNSLAIGTMEARTIMASRDSLTNLREFSQLLDEVVGAASVEAAQSISAE